jgi:hypothetical protein
METFGYDHNKRDARIGRLYVLSVNKGEHHFYVSSLLLAKRQQLLCFFYQRMFSAEDRQISRRRR